MFIVYPRDGHKLGYVGEGCAVHKGEVYFGCPWEE